MFRNKKERAETLDVDDELNESEVDAALDAPSTGGADSSAGPLEETPQPPAAVPAAVPAAGGAPEAARGAPQPNRAGELVKEKGRRLNLVNNQTLMPAISRAVAFALDAHLDWVDTEIKRSVVREARANLVDALKSSSKKVRGLPEQAFLKKVTAERDRIVSERQQAETELTNLMTQLQAKREDLHIRSQMIANESAAAGVMHDRLMAEQIRIAFEECADDPQRLYDRVTQIALQSTEGERAKLVDVQVSEHQREIENFERRISKLTQSLQMTEEEMRRIAAAKNIDLGVASVFRNVQGLSADDAQLDRKKELMSTIFEANFELRQALDAALPE